MGKTLWESIPRRIIGYTCPNCNKRWTKSKAPNYCPECGTFIRQYPIKEYLVPEVYKCNLES